MHERDSANDGCADLPQGDKFRDDEEGDDDCNDDDEFSVFSDENDDGNDEDCFCAKLALRSIHCKFGNKLYRFTNERFVAVDSV